MSHGAARDVAGLVVDEFDAVLLISVFGIHKQRRLIVAPRDGVRGGRLVVESDVRLSRGGVLQNTDRRDGAKLTEHLRR